MSRSRSFVYLKNAHEETLKAGCCGLGIDSTTHFWQDLSTNGMKNGKGPWLSRIMRIKEEWAPFAADFQDFPIHSIATGRLGYQWEDVEVENDLKEANAEYVKLQ